MKVIFLFAKERTIEQLRQGGKGHHRISGGTARSCFKTGDFVKEKLGGLS